jgi:hypothetical protein
MKVTLTIYQIRISLFFHSVGMLPIMEVVDPMEIRRYLFQSHSSQDAVQGLDS